jgi:Family of unknown function (DUF5309)
MAAYDRHTAIGAREDLTDVIYDISPTDTPIMSSIGKTKATSVYHEWQTDSLAAATTSNALVEGASATEASITPTTRLGNYTQIVGKTVMVSGTLLASDLAGRKSEMAYQLAKASAEIKRDIETIITANQGQTAASTGNARKMGSLLSYIKSNTNVSAGTTAGVDPTTIGVSTRTDGTTRTFTETILKDVIKQVFESGGTPSVLMVSPALKQTVSGFTGLAAQRYQVPTNGQATILAGADLYQSDFGVLQIVPNRFMRTRDALVLDPEYAALAYLRPFQTNDIAKVGDAEKKQILAELTLEVRNEAAHGGAFDLSA